MRLSRVAACSASAGEAKTLHASAAAATRSTHTLPRPASDPSWQIRITVPYTRDPLIRQIVVYALAFVAHSSTFITIRIHSGPKPNTAPNTEPSRADQAEASRVARGVSSTSKKSYYLLHAGRAKKSFFLASICRANY